MTVGGRGGKKGGRGKERERKKESTVEEREEERESPWASQLYISIPSPPFPFFPYPFRAELVKLAEEGEGIGEGELPPYL